MKNSVILFIVACAIAAGAIVYLKKPKTPTLVAPATETTAVQPGPRPEEIASNSKPQPPVTTPPPSAPAPVVTAPTPAAEPAPAEPTNSIRKTVDALLVAREQKHALFQQLNKEQLEAVIADLQQRAAANPKDAEIPTTLGEAQLNLVRTLHESGSTDQDQLGILAMQADQSFNTALKLDPQNWEAQFVKASTMYYWPANEARDNDAAQRLSNLIDQQETMPTQPVFAQTYLALVKQYQKMGKQDEAAATLKLALQKFPSDPALLQMAAGRPN